MSESFNLQDIFDSIKQLQSEFCNGNEVLSDKIKSLDVSINKVLAQLTDQSNKVSNLEKMHRIYENNYKRNNLILFNFPENPKENIWDLEKEIELFLKNVIKTTVNLNEIDFIRRIGVKKGNRPILIRFIAYRRKIEVLRLAKNLKGSNLALSEDFLEEIRKIRKALYPYWKAAREENKRAYMRYDKLLVDNKFWSLEELQRGSITNVNYASESEKDDSSLTGTENLSDDTLRRWLQEGKLMKKKKINKRKADGSPGKGSPFRRPRSRQISPKQVEESK